MKTNVNILLVDDDPITNFVNKSLLEKLEMVGRVQVAKNGKMALQLLEEQPSPDFVPDLILLDISMPVMSGIEFMQAYKELPVAQRGAIKVIILTTSNHPRDLECLNDMPVAGILNKPLTSPDITALLEKHFAE